MTDNTETPRMPNFWWSPTSGLWRGGDERPCADAVKLGDVETPSVSSPEGGDVEIGDDVIVTFEGRPVAGTRLPVKAGWDGDQFVELPAGFAVPVPTPSELPVAPNLGAGDSPAVRYVGPSSPEELAEQCGFLPGQIVSSANGEERYDVLKLIRQAWTGGTFHPAPSVGGDSTDTGTTGDVVAPPRECPHAGDSTCSACLPESGGAA